MKLLLSITGLSFIALHAIAQLTPTPNEALSQDSLKDVVISAARSAEHRKEVAQQIKVILRSEIQETNAATTADLLQTTGAATVQKSQLGGGSPVLRGFEANRVLLVVDGVRHNNLIFRSGHLQNIISLDANIANRIEVLYGNGALMYGSDALGGVVHLTTVSPTLSQSKPFEVSGNTFARYGNAPFQMTAHANLNLAGRYFASRTVVTASTFGDLRKGSNNLFGYAGFGECTQYVSGYSPKTDSIYKNTDPNIQVGSNYGQIDVMQRFRYQRSAAHEHNLNFQFSTSSIVPRYDRLQTFSNGKPRFSQWYYGPQQRVFASYQYTNKASKLWDRFNAIIAYQGMDESRWTRKFKDSILFGQIELVQMASVNIDATKQLGRHELRYGMETVFQQNNSEAFNVNINYWDTGVLSSPSQTAADTRYPHGRGNSFGIYLTDAVEFDEKGVLRGGIRFSHNSLSADFSQYRIKRDVNYNNVTQSNTNLDGSLGGVLFFKNGFRLAANVATGFRAPNIDDLGKTFEQTNTTIVLPNPNLRPERTVQKEVTIERSRPQGFGFAVTAFHTHLFDAIAIKPLALNGADSVSYNGTRYLAVANVNITQAEIYGATLSISTPIVGSLSANAAVTYTVGRDLTNQVPLDHIPPVYGNLFLQYKAARWSATAFALFNGWKHTWDYSPTGEDNPDKATADGTFAWYTLNLRGSFDATPRLKIQVTAENLLDANYRTFASGISAPGRNLVATLRYSF